jgi:hypothetical protein
MDLLPKLSLNIIAHELEGLGSVGINVPDSSTEVMDVRMPSHATGDSLFLYVVGDGYEMPSDVEGDYLTLRVVDVDAVDTAASLILHTDKTVVEVFSLLQDVVYRYHQWEREMDRLLIEGGTVQDLVDVSEGFLANHLVVVDPALKLLAYSRHVECDDPVTVELIEHGYHTDENIRKFKLSKRFEPWSREPGFIVNDSYRICKYRTVVYSFKTGSSFSLIAVMMCNRVEPDAYLLDIYRIFLKRLEYFARREYPKTKPSGNIVDSFIRDLLTGDLAEPASIAERSAFAQIPRTGRFCLFCVGLGEDADNPTARIIAEIAQKTAPAKVILFGASIIVFCFNCRDHRSHCPRNCRVCSLDCTLSGSFDSSETTTTVVSRLEETLAQYGLFCGRSASFTDLSQMHVAYLQARTAVDLAVSHTGDGEESPGALAEGENVSRMFNFDDYLFRLMLQNGQVEGEDIIGMGSAGRTLEQIEEYDAAHGTDNYPFLKTYLRLERRMSAVSEALHMHRNNVRYRAHRIEELFGIDTENADQREDLLCAFMIRDAAQQCKMHKENSSASSF